jgi:glycogen(starch) synthase
MFSFSVGGIYTVIKTKAAVTTEELGDQYCMIGPYNESCVRTEVEVLEPSCPALSATLKQMREHGIKVRWKH